MEKLNQLKNKRLGLIAILIVGIIVIPVAAQLLSNLQIQTITVHSLDESFIITPVYEMETDTWVNEEIVASMHIEKIRSTSGKIYIRINQSDDLDIDVSDFTLEIGYRKADNTAHADPMAVILEQVDNSSVQFKETVWFFESQTESHYVIVLTFLGTCPGGNYEVIVFIDST